MVDRQASSKLMYFPFRDILLTRTSALFLLPYLARQSQQSSLFFRSRSRGHMMEYHTILTLDRLVWVMEGSEMDLRLLEYLASPSHPVIPSTCTCSLSLLFVLIGLLKYRDNFSVGLVRKRPRIVMRPISPIFLEQAGKNIYITIFFYMSSI